MGIVLPGVNVNNVNYHQRNRSLDSALQQIPEVDVTPSPEVEAHPGSDDSGIICGLVNFYLFFFCSLTC
ncbi:hypothetical protein O3M35_009637 [Rhynocoris fuscipes]|uniref:Uncharacterized protein n=1 Tax=Rhynocoris fuscipes TaxID=488301 RepID=A0AAW1D6K9_9HEMI